MPGVKGARKTATTSRPAKRRKVAPDAAQPDDPITAAAAIAAAFRQHDSKGCSTYTGLIDIEALRNEVRGGQTQLTLGLKDKVREKALNQLDDNKDISRFIVNFACEIAGLTFNYHDRRELKGSGPYGETIRWFCAHREGKNAGKRGRRALRAYACAGQANVSIVRGQMAAQLVLTHIHHSKASKTAEDAPQARPKGTQTGKGLEEWDEEAGGQATAPAGPSTAAEPCDGRALAKRGLETAARDLAKLRRGTKLPTGANEVDEPAEVDSPAVPEPDDGSDYEPEPEIDAEPSRPATSGNISSDHEGELELELDDDDDDDDYQQGSDLDSHPNTTPSTKRARTSSAEPGLLAALASEAARAIPIPTPPRFYDPPTPFGEQSGPDPEEEAIQEAERVLNEALDILKRCRSARVDNGRSGGGMLPARERAWQATLLHCGVARDSISALGMMR